MHMPHSSIADFIIVHLQQLALEITYESNPPDGFLEYRKGLHPPPGVSLSPFGGDIFLLPDVTAVFLPYIQTSFTLP